MEKNFLKRYKLDDKGYYNIDHGYKIWRRVGFHDVYPVTIGDKCFYFKGNSPYGKKNDFKAIFNGSREFASGDFYQISEIFYSKLAQKFGIHSVDYTLAKVGKKRGVISNDFADMQSGESADLETVLNDIGYMGTRNDLRYLHSVGLFDYCEGSVVDQFQVLSLFDYATNQVDRNSSNVALAKEQGKKYSKVIAFDYGVNDLSIFFNMSDDKFKQKVSRGLELSMGIEIPNSSSERYLFDVSNSRFIRSKNIAKFIKCLDKGLQNNNFISDIHHELVDEYAITEKETLDKFETRLSDVLNVNGEKLYKAYGERSINKQLEF